MEYSGLERGVGKGFWFARTTRRALVILMAGLIAVAALAGRARGLTIEKRETALAPPTCVALGSPVHRRPTWLATTTAAWPSGSIRAATPTVVNFDFASTGLDVSVMGADGTLAAPATLTDRTLPVSNQATVGLGNGRSLVVYSRLVPESDFGNYQVRFQIVDSATPGDGGTVIVDAGADRATDGGDGGAVGDAVTGAADGPSGDLPPLADASADVFDASAADLRAEASADAQADSRADTRAGASDGALADGGADAGAALAGSGCSCAIEPGRGPSWCWIAVALALQRWLRRRRSRA